MMRPCRLASAVYRLGTLAVAGGVPQLRRALDGPPPTPLLRLDGRKAEAIAVLAGGARAAARVVLGTDDELQGGAILQATLSRRERGGAPATVVPVAGGARAHGACTPAPGGAPRP